MKNADAKKIILFISKNSSYFSTNIDDFREIVSVLGKLSPFNVEVVDVSEQPELAEKYRIDALPTLIIANVKYVGKPSAEKAIEIFKKGLLIYSS